MDVPHERCAGLDISKKDAKACVRTSSMKQRGTFPTETTTWDATTNADLALRDLTPARTQPAGLAGQGDHGHPAEQIEGGPDAFQPDLVLCGVVEGSA
ncbi:hypothetical protein ACIQAC_39195 [Streptomyces sp. NPDC088387]|uniref:hypothetical protein n=1 Tax=Streptomyces sp. NPDC088387 TaxID=3365859 RepID=UPI00382548FF